MVASLGRDMVSPAPSALRPRCPGGTPIRWVASADCLAQPLRGVLAQLAASFGADQGQLDLPQQAGTMPASAGRQRSYHLTGNAVDFRVRCQSERGAGVPDAVTGWWAASSTTVVALFHIDTGPRRTWAARKRYRR